MPEDWEGYPLRKDLRGRPVPVQFKEAPGPDDRGGDTEGDLTTPSGLIGETQEGAQELLPRTETSPAELGRERARCCGVPEDTQSGDPRTSTFEAPDDET